jgi:hypothetical protein
MGSENKGKRSQIVDDDILMRSTCYFLCINLEEWMADSGVALQGNGHRQVDGAGQPYVDEGEKDGQQLLVQARQVHAARHKARLETTGRLY